MTIRWKPTTVVASIVLSVVAIGNRGTVGAAPRATATVKTVASNLISSAGMSIPDTTLAINSPTPPSQRVMHYDIDAEATNHTIAATEVVSYHNLTGPALDHFPFHVEGARPARPRIPSRRRA